MSDINPQTARYRRRSAEVEAVQWTDNNADQLAAFAGQRFMTVAPEDRVDDPDATAALMETEHSTWFDLVPGDWVVRRGGVWEALGPEEFADLYEPATASSAPVDRAAILREAAALLDQRASGIDALSSSDYGSEADTVRELAAAANELRRLAAAPPASGPGRVADETQAPDVVTAIVTALQERAGELSALAEEQMRPSLEERAQEWLEAADVARKAAVVSQPVRHAPGIAVLCVDCRAKGHSICVDAVVSQPGKEG